MSDRIRGGAYANVRKDLLPGQEKAVFIPPLILLLAHRERESGRVFSEQEVLEVLKNAACIAMENADAEEFARSRGRDLDPDNVWTEWCQVRETIKGLP